MEHTDDIDLSNVGHRGKKVEEIGQREHARKPLKTSVPTGYAGPEEVEMENEVASWIYGFTWKMENSVHVC